MFHIICLKLDIVKIIYYFTNRKLNINLFDLSRYDDVIMHLSEFVCVK